ncbi:hypothetical protein IWX49DRAFT_560597 [Phyllosticta citricarpa]
MEFSLPRPQNLLAVLSLSSLSRCTRTAAVTRCWLDDLDSLRSHFINGAWLLRFKALCAPVVSSTSSRNMVPAV